MSEEKNIICIEDNKKNHDALVNVATTIYYKRINEMNLPLSMGNYFSKYVAKKQNQIYLKCYYEQ